MRVVLDTNVLIAAFIARGVCHELLEHSVREHAVVLSEFILDEFEDKLKNKFRFPPGKVGEALRLLRAQMEIVEPLPLPSSVCRDLDDDWVLATAITGGCHCIVTGDDDLLTLEEHAGIRILNPKGYWIFQADAEQP